MSTSTGHRMKLQSGRKVSLTRAQVQNYSDHHDIFSLITLGQIHPSFTANRTNISYLVSVFVSSYLCLLLSLYFVRLLQIWAGRCWCTVIRIVTGLCTATRSSWSCCRRVSGKGRSQRWLRDRGRRRAERTTTVNPCLQVGLNSLPFSLFVCLLVDRISKKNELTDFTTVLWKVRRWAKKEPINFRCRWSHHVASYKALCWGCAELLTCLFVP